MATKPESVTSHFRCGACGAPWSAVWDQIVNDDCPKCGTTNCPIASQREPVADDYGARLHDAIRDASQTVIDVLRTWDIPIRCGDPVLAASIICAALSPTIRGLTPAPETAR